jgi:hypothetical protein
MIVSSLVVARVSLALRVPTVLGSICFSLEGTAAVPPF